LRTAMPFTALIVLGLLAWPPWAAGQDQTCKVPAFRGATLPKGADAVMHVVNTGRECGIRNFGQASDVNSLASSGSITKPPQNGTARFEPPSALYTPNPGFAGEDYFEYQAHAKGPQDKPVVLTVRVKVTVTAP
jgi:Bacterial Ig domain